MTVWDPGMLFSLAEPTAAVPNPHATAIAGAAALHVITNRTAPWLASLDDLEQQLLAAAQMDLAHAEAGGLAVDEHAPEVRARRLHPEDRRHEDAAHAGVVLTGPLAVRGRIERAGGAGARALAVRRTALGDPPLHTALRGRLEQGLVEALDLHGHGRAGAGAGGQRDT